MSEVAIFDFDGLDSSALVLDSAHGPCIHSERFIRWLGWARPSDVRRDHLQPGDEVEISTSIKRGRGVTKSDVKHLTKRGVQRLLFRSNLPRAIQYTNDVLNVLDALDRDGMVIDEKRITDAQLDAGEARISQIRVRRLEEKMDYQTVRRILCLGGAVSEEYADVQNTLYVLLFGKTAARIRATQPQVNGTPRKRGTGFRKSDIAKDYLTEDQLADLNSTVLATVAQLERHYPKGAPSAVVIEAIRRAVVLVRRPPGLAA